MQLCFHVSRTCNGFQSAKELIARTQYAEDAAVLVSNLPPGSTIEWQHPQCTWGVIVWTEGADGDAADSFDGTAEKMHQRIVDALAEHFIGGGK